MSDTFDYTQSSKDVKKKYKKDKVSKRRLKNSNMINSLLNTLRKTGNDMGELKQKMLAGQDTLQTMRPDAVLKKSMYKKIGKANGQQLGGRPSILNKCGSHR